MSGLSKKEMKELEDHIHHDAMSGGGFYEFAKKHKKKFGLTATVLASLAALYGTHKHLQANQDAFDARQPDNIAYPVDLTKIHPEYKQLASLEGERRSAAKRGDGKAENSERLKKVHAYRKAHGCSLKSAWAGIKK